MAVIVPYTQVAERLTGDGLNCLYFNSGAFGFVKGVKSETVGWISTPDPTIRPAALPFTRQIREPFEQCLAAAAMRIWRDHLPGVAWVHPKAHWAYELMFGSQEWLPALLAGVGIDAANLEPCHDGSAIEFGAGDEASFERFVAGLLGRLFGSDFMLTFPGRPVVCTVHHHKQLWWTTTDPAVAEALRAAVP